MGTTKITAGDPGIAPVAGMARKNVREEGSREEGGAASRMLGAPQGAAVGATGSAPSDVAEEARKNKFVPLRRGAATAKNAGASSQREHETQNERRLSARRKVSFDDGELSARPAPKRVKRGSGVGSVVPPSACGAGVTKSFVGALLVEYDCVFWYISPHNVFFQLGR